MNIEDRIRQIVREEVMKVVSQLNDSFNERPTYIPVKQFQKLYGVSTATLYRHIKAKHLSLFKLGGKSFLLLSEVDKMFVKVK